MKVLILAGGYGTRLSEETGIRPKPMVEIGGRPILWHIMKHYSHYGLNEFIILCGYMGEYIKEFFFNYYINNSSITFNLQSNTFDVISTKSEPWSVTCLDTGIGTLTGGRILRAKELIGDQPFLLTYGDGLSDVNIDELLSEHKVSKRVCTLTAVRPQGRFGSLEIAPNNQITSFKEKPQGEFGRINGGFFVCEPSIFDYIKDGDQSIFERGPLEDLASQSQLHCYKHNGFWKCMDTLADKNSLNSMWNNGEAKWKIWKD